MARKREFDLAHIYNMVDRALSAGARRIGLSRVRWDISGDCTRPYVQEFYARPSGDEDVRFIRRPQGRRRIVVGRETRVPMTLEIHTPCRSCEKCKLHRQRLWAARARQETAAAARTWFGTLTLRPESWLHACNQCRAKEAAQGVDFDALPEAERLALIHARTGAEVTKMLKRIRTLVPTGLVRFLVVLEVTKAGVIHYHLLVHELSEGSPIRHKQLSDQWKLGFAKWRLLGDPAEAGYVAKYLSKSLLARVRASEGYGGAERPLQDATTRLSHRAPF